SLGGRGPLGDHGDPLRIRLPLCRRAGPHGSRHHHRSPARQHPRGGEPVGLPGPGTRHQGRGGPGPGRPSGGRDHGSGRGRSHRSGVRGVPRTAQGAGSEDREGVMFRTALLAAMSLVVVLGQPALAANPEGSTVEVGGAGGGYLEMNGRRYRGPFRITAESDGVGVVEVTALDTYLEGIREVPFSWNAEALAAQVVAARTYLAWTMIGGRTETGRR